MAIRSLNRKAIGLRVWRTRGPMGLRLNEESTVAVVRTRIESALPDKLSPSSNMLRTVEEPDKLKLQRMV